MDSDSEDFFDYVNDTITDIPELKYFRQFKDNTYSSLNPINNTDIDSYYLNSMPPIIHQIWIGNKITEPALMLNRSLTQNPNLRTIIYYWVDKDILSEDEIEKILDSNPMIEIKNVRKSKVFPLIENIYNILLKARKFNFIKEIFSLGVIYQYGGYYFDTTTTIDTVDVPKLMISFDKLFLVKAGNDLDVFFYYSPRKFELTGILLTYMINTYRVILELGFNKNITFEEFLKNNMMNFARSKDDNEILLRLNYLILVNKCGIEGDSVDYKSNYFMNTFTCFIQSLLKIDEEKYGFKSLRVISSKINDDFREYYIGNGISMRKFFGRTGWYKIE